MPRFPASPSYFLHLRMSRLLGVWVAVSGFLFLLTRRELSLLEQVIICGFLQCSRPRAKELPHIYLPPRTPRCAPDEQIKRGRDIKEMLSMVCSPGHLTERTMFNASFFCSLALHKALALPETPALPHVTHPPLLSLSTIFLPDSPPNLPV